MQNLDTTVCIVGCGAAGVTAAIGLARRGVPVIVVEGGQHPGAENWSGSVYFAENLARPEILGEELLAQTPIERRVVKRGLLLTDGRCAPGVSLHSEEAFRHCYTVLRPLFDHDLAEKARLFGARILSGTQALGLLRDGDRVRGVLTDRGPITADVVFLAEGDASNLVTREGLETKAPGEDGLVRPEFLQGVKEVLELPAGEIERRFGVGPDEGACYETLLRNGVLDGRPVPLNAGSFLYTNRNSLSFGFVAPLENLTHFKGAHNQLMEWLKGLPSLAPLLEGAKSVSFGAKVIRGGGWKEMPRLALDGLCVGGAASGIGVDFPCPNYTGPASFMGYAFSEAVGTILEGDGRFDQAALEKEYVEKVRASVYCDDVHHLRDWPHFVSSTREFFGRQVDVAAQTAHVLTDPDNGVFERHLLAARTAYETVPFGRLGRFLKDVGGAGTALRAWSGIFLDLPLALFWWTINLVIGWFPRPATKGARLVPEFFATDAEKRRTAPAIVRYLRWRLGPGIAEALFQLYRNDGTPLRKKLPAMRRALLYRLNWIDLVVGPLWLGLVYLTGAVHAALFRLKVAMKKPSIERILATPYFRQREASRALTDYRRAKEVDDHDGKLATISYQGDHATHIHFHAAYDDKGLPDDGTSSLFSVCPAKVYQAETDQSLQHSVAVLHENCVRCETCWRADDRHVDWGRTRGHKLIFEAYSDSDAWLAESRIAAALADIERADDEDDGAPEAAPAPPVVSVADELRESVHETVRDARRHAAAFLTLNHDLPGVVTGGDQDLLARLAGEVFHAVERLDGMLSGVLDAGVTERRAALSAWRGLATPRLQSRRFFHLETDFLLLDQWHLPDLAARFGFPMPELDPAETALAARRLRVRTHLEERLTREVIAECEARLHPTIEAKEVLLGLSMGLTGGEKGYRHPGSTARDLALEELARLSPSLAAVFASHLAACDLVFVEGVAARNDGDLEDLRAEIAGGHLVLGFYDGSEVLSPEGRLEGTLNGVLVGGVDMMVVRRDTTFAAVAPTDEGVTATAVGGLGLRGAGPGRIRFEGAAPRALFDGDGLDDLVQAASPLDLVAIARGMGDYFAERAFDHATSRVQFPALFRDLRGRDGLAKFGAVQAMLSGITQGTELLESFRGRHLHGGATAALALDVLGCSPRSIAYLAGQVLGGTAYSEEDPVSRLYRDASALRRLPRFIGKDFREQGALAIEEVRPGSDALPGLDRKREPLPPTEWWSSLVSQHLEPVREAVQDLTRAVCELDGSLRAALNEDLGRVVLQVGGVRLLAERAEATLSRGEPAGVTLGALEAFAARIAGRATRLARRVPDTPQLLDLGRQLLDVERVEGETGAGGATYQDYLTDGASFRSGDLFLKPGHGESLVYCPELLEADPALSTYRAKTDRDFKRRFLEGEFEGGAYQRLVEKEHHVPLEDIRFLLDDGYFRMVIPEEHLGLGQKKANYYIACSAMMRHADPTQAIIVMGSTSIGTSPIMIGLFEDLGRAKKSLQALTEDPAAVNALADEARSIRNRSFTPEVLQLAGPMKALMGKAKKTLGRAKAARPVFREFQGALQKAGLAGARQDLDGFRRGLEKAVAALEGWEERIQDELATLPFREQAHVFYLQLIAAGHVSAFALTEPSAGSDTARVRTQAVRTAVEVTADPRGFFTFTPEGSDERRNLFTYDSLEMKEGRLRFIRPDRERVDVEIQDFDYEKKAGEDARYRFVILDGERIEIHDIGRVDSENGRDVYPYFRVNGAKMWITNGSVAGVMVLYARTVEGLSGFMLDAHAEGLTIGKDEEKMGQRGSATNELSLAEVRIPVDQVIGIEGRGQENALETLNVGRSGLAICSVGLMHEVAGDVREGLAGREPELEQLYQLGKMALDLVGSESLAYGLVGRFDHPGTASIRMESAIAKARTSEALHRLISRAEQVLGPGWALDDHLLEKRRRDARVLTIYEGTNEIQRFLLTKDMIDVLDVEQLETAGDDAEPTRLALDTGRREIVSRLLAMREELGSRAWQAVNLQPLVFNLVEGLMQCAVLGASLHRLALARRLVDAEQGQARLEWLELACGLLARDLSRWEPTLLRDLEREQRRVREGRDPLHQVIADRAILRHEAVPEVVAAPPASTIEGTLRIAVVLQPRPVLAPRPRITDGRVREHLLELSDTDRGVLQSALELREAGAVEVTTIALGAADMVNVLEETLALGADRAFLLDKGRATRLAPELAAEIASLIRTREELTETRFDLILGADEHAGTLLPLARRLELTPISGVHRFGVTRDAERQTIEARLAKPEVVVGHEGRALLLVQREVPATTLSYSIDDWRRVKDRQVTVIDLEGSDQEVVRMTSAAVANGGAPSSEAQALGLDETAARLAAEAGLSGGGESDAGPWLGDIDELGVDEFLDGIGVLAVISAEADGDLAPGGRAAIAAALDAALPARGLAGVLVLLPTQEDDAVRSAAGEIKPLASGARVGFLASEDLAAQSPMARAGLLESGLGGFDGPVIFAPELRASALLAGEGLSLDRGRPVLVEGIDRLERQNGNFLLSGLAFDGKARFELSPSAKTEGLYLIVRPDFAPDPSRQAAVVGEGRVARVRGLEGVMAQDEMGRLLAAALGEVGADSLADAEFIIDVGYGVGSRDGIEEVIEPLKEALERAGVKRVTIGATRKVTMDLGILPDDRQIGQTGTPVNPAIMIAVGVSGAPQHLEYIGPRAVIFAFNKDAEAPLMALNQSRPKPKVYPIVGDLFEQVPKFIEALETTLARA